MSTVLDNRGQPVNYEQALIKMDADLKRSVEDRLGDATPQEIYEAYCAAHELRFGEEFQA